MKKLTISSISYSGKWVEFWFEEEENAYDPTMYLHSTKIGRFNDLIDEARLFDDTAKHGFIGLVTYWEQDESAARNWTLMKVEKPEEKPAIANANPSFDMSNMVPVVISKYCDRIKTTIEAHMERAFAGGCLVGLTYRGSVRMTKSEVEKLTNPLILTEDSFLGEYVTIYDVELESEQELTFTFSVGSGGIKDWKILYACDRELVETASTKLEICVW